MTRSLFMISPHMCYTQTQSLFIRPKKHWHLSNTNASCFLNRSQFTSLQACDR